jgi:nucleotide-binding universal stress UspA family protein
MKHKLLVAVDGEKTSWKTAIYVGRACAGAGDGLGGIVLFHVLPPLPMYYGARDLAANIESLAERFDRETRAAAEQMLAEMKERVVREGVHPKAVAVEIADQRGSVVSQVLSAAARHECDTIVIGRRGRSMVGQFFLGSVAEQLLRNRIGFTVWVVQP